MEPTPFIQGEKIDLLPLNISNVEIYVKWVNRPKIRKFGRSVIPKTVEQWKKLIHAEEKGIKDSVSLEIWHKSDQKPIGELGLFNINWFDKKAYIGLSIGEIDYWNQGICTEALKLITNYAFAELNLNKLYSYIFAPNKASCRCVEKNGFIREAILKKDVFIDGKYEDTYFYSIFKEDWMKLNG